MSTAPSALQREFNARYITTSEIMREVGVTRTAVFTARKLGKLADPIIIEGQLCIWEREKVKEYLAAWTLITRARRKVLGNKQEASRTLMAS